MRGSTLTLSVQYRDVIRFALYQQVPWAILCTLLLDGGRVARICGVAMLGFWAGVALIMARRPVLPTRWDLRYVRWGFWPVFALLLLIEPLL